MKKIKTVLRSARRLTNSANGNPRWMVHTDAGAYATAADASVGYEVSNLLHTTLGRVDQGVTIVIDGREQITDILR